MRGPYNNSINADAPLVGVFALCAVSISVLTCKGVPGGAPVMLNVMCLMILLRLIMVFALGAVVLTGCSGVRSNSAQHEEAYRLLIRPSENERNEYGWICEYSTVGMPPDQRLATLSLVQHRKVDLLREALRGPNLEGRVYAADALLYLAEIGRVDLTGSDEKAIQELRRSDAEVRTCGNAGSYKIYPEPVREVLSDSVVARIPEMYEMLAENGYWKR